MTIRCTVPTAFWKNDMSLLSAATSIAMTLIKSIVLFVALASVSASSADEFPVEWPSYPTHSDEFRVDSALGRNGGLTNTVPDVIGPVDGSARLTIFTEGNQYPVLLPLTLQAFPAFCAASRQCDLSADEILIVTLPQVMITNGIERGGFRFGNMTLPVAPDGAVFPDIVMLGHGPMARLEEQNLLRTTPRLLARHRGMGLLVDRTYVKQAEDLEALAASDLSFVIATPFERGARKQYIATLDELLGVERTASLLSREIQDFPGRLAIQHRDIPYAVMNRIAPVGLIFGHLARFYAERSPERLAYVEIPEAAAFGSDITVATTRRQRGDVALTSVFLEFLFERSSEAYEAGGFARTDSFAFGQEMEDEASTEGYWLETIGSREQMLSGGDLSAAYRLSDLNVDELSVAVGPAAGLDGEITVYNGEVFVSRIRRTGQLVQADLSTGGPFIAYGATTAWREVDVPMPLSSTKELEDWLGQSLESLGLDPEKGFPFRIEGEVAELTYHVLKRPRHANAHTHRSHHKAKVSFQENNQQVRIAGVWVASQNVGVVTHPGERTHLHVIVDHGQGAGHVDALELEPGFRLFVPQSTAE